MTFILSCRRSEDKDNNEEFSKPTEKCENISFDNQRPIITYGFDPENYDSVIVQSFVKNSRFETLIHSYKIQLSPISSDTCKVRFLTLLKETTTNADIQLTLNDTLKYLRTGAKNFSSLINFIGKIIINRFIKLNFELKK